MYTNISVKEATNIIHNILDNNHQISIQDKHTLITLLNTTPGQNYVQLDNAYYKQTGGLAMGAPTSAIVADIFIQHLEPTKIVEILNRLRRYTDCVQHTHHIYRDHTSRP
jgi:hypothetical protein